jgi:sugar lactone lactonase YvrE
VRRLASVLLLALLAFVGLRCGLGGGRRLEDRTAAPVLPASALEVVADLDYPPGNIAVTPAGRVFLTLHPDGDPPLQLAELVNGRPVPFPDDAFQHSEKGTPHFQSLLSVRLDRQGRLWTLDFARYARGQPRILAFDTESRQLVHQYDFPSDVAGFLSMLNDFQVDPRDGKIYIADASPIRQKPALVVYDPAARTSRRVLDGDVSVRPKDFVAQAPGRDMVLFGFYTLRIGVDSITLDDRGEWLYYGPFSGDRLYRIATRDLNDPSLSPAALAAKVEDFAPKTISDGLTIDLGNEVFVSDPEHSAILRLGADRRLVTLLKDARLRWPDGFSWGPDGWLYVTCSSLQHVIFKSAGHIREHAPYQVFRFRPGAAGVPGH